MNYNANLGARPPGPARKAKRVSDVNAVPTAPSYIPPANSYDNQRQQPIYGVPQMNPMAQLAQPTFQTGTGVDMPYPNMDYSNTVPIQSDIQRPYPNMYPVMGGGGIGPASGPNQSQQMDSTMNQMPPQFGMFQQPIVQDMAMQYGQKLADHGKQLVESQFEKYIPVTRLKYYFAVDNKYVINKLRLLFFPFSHTDWSLKYNQDTPVPPRYDVNANDLYIPAMAYITYVLLAGLILGMQNRFTPEQIGIQASSALAYSLIELIIYSITLYVTNIQTNLKTLDLLALAGYKFAIICVCILVSVPFQKTGYYISLIYCSLALAFFMLRSLKANVLHESATNNSSAPLSYDAYGTPIQQPAHDYSSSQGRKRKLYFLFLVAGLQPIMSFWLSMHLIPQSKLETVVL